ncbi:MAG: hypothetical protein MUC51_17685, partial [Anaerolineae bacterium]|nr:hypothetical protein [Anaerolineae bacterium]
MAKDTKHEDRRVALPLRAFVGLRVFALLTLTRNTLYLITVPHHRQHGAFPGNGARRGAGDGSGRLCQKMAKGVSVMLRGPSGAWSARRR